MRAKWVILGTASVALVAALTWAVLLPERQPQDSVPPAPGGMADLPSGDPTAWVPIKAGEGADVPRAALPAGTIVLNASDAAEIGEPFVLREDSSAALGLALTIPKGARSGKGFARFDAQAAQAGRYRMWARVRWQDSCSNSVSVQVGNSRPRDAGHDNLFGAWHWVEAGTHMLNEGPNEVALREREDGIAADQLLLTQDPEYRPTGPVGRGGEGYALRRFDDDFSRSPGHGMEAWDLKRGDWKIHFSFDPNRVPLQYALEGGLKETGEGPAEALVKEAPWFGATMRFALLPQGEGCFGAVLDEGVAGIEPLYVGFEFAGGKAALVVEGAGLKERIDVTGRVRIGQWHRVEIERWAYVLRVFVDRREVLARYDARIQPGRVGFFVAGGQATFDDLSVCEALWQADDGARRIPWIFDPNAQWFRAEDRQAPALLGRAGVLRARLGGLSVEEVVLEPAEGSGAVGLDATGLALAGTAPVQYRRPAFEEASAEEVALKAGAGEARLRRVAIRYGRPAREEFVLGPYHFTQAHIEDPSDYLDFTKEEYEAMQRSPEAGKLMRRAKHRPLVSSGTDNGLWSRESGSWLTRNGVLYGRGPGARLLHCQELVSDLEIRFRMRLLDRHAAAGIEFFAAPKAGTLVSLAPQAHANEKPALALAVPADGEWHAVVLRAEDGRFSGRVDQGAWTGAAVPRGDGGQLLLHVFEGQAEFDDIEFAIPRRPARGLFAAFDLREPDWWRAGGEWIDHGGIACAMASNWVSLAAPDGEGMLWAKTSFGSDLQLACGVEENTTWYGWDRHPSHTHFPFDNIRLVVSPGTDPDQGYRLEVNSGEPRATILFRNGKEVARAEQDHGFPMRYRGGHAPFSPRRNRIALTKRGGELGVVVNGQDVLRWQDPEPIAVKQAGLGGVRTHINFSFIEVRDLSAREAPARQEDYYSHK